MDTIKAIVVKKLRQKRGNNAEIADYMVSNMVKQCLEDVCCVFPDGTSAGREFAGIMSEFMVEENPNGNPKMLDGETTKSLIKKAIDALYYKVTEEPDTVDDKYCAGYTHLRQKLIEAINSRR